MSVRITSDGHQGTDRVDRLGFSPLVHADPGSTRLETHVVSGRLSDSSSGGPVSGTVRFGDELVIQAPCGQYSVTLEAGMYAVEARAPFHYPVTGTIVVDEDQQRDFVLSPTRCLLLVDDDYDGDGDPHDDQTYYEAALNELGIGYTLWSVPDDADGPPQAALDLYHGIVWLTGRDWDFTLTAADQGALASYLDGGGRLFISGQDIGSDLERETPAGSFYGDYLHARYLLDDSGHREVSGNGWMSGLDLTIHGGDGADNQARPSDIDVVGDASGLLYYPDGDWAATAYGDDTYRVVYFAFGFEAISSDANRRETMRRVVEFLDPCDIPALEFGAYLPLILRVP